MPLIFDFHVCVDRGENEEIVQEVHDDRRQKSIGEGEVEEHHSHEPAVGPTKGTLIFVPITELVVGGKKRCRNGPGCGVHQLIRQIAQSEEVGYMTERIGKKFDQAPAGKTDMGEEAAKNPVDHDYGGESRQIAQPTESDLLKEAGRKADPETGFENAFGVPVVVGVVESARQKKGVHRNSPEEDPLGRPEPVPEGTLRRPEIQESAGHSRREKKVSHADDGQRNQNSKDMPEDMDGQGPFQLLIHRRAGEGFFEVAQKPDFSEHFACLSCLVGVCSESADSARVLEHFVEHQDDEAWSPAEKEEMALGSRSKEGGGVERETQRQEAECDERQCHLFADKLDELTVEDGNDEVADGEGGEAKQCSLELQSSHGDYPSVCIDTVRFLNTEVF